MSLSRYSMIGAVVLSVVIALGTLRIIPLGVELSFPEFSPQLDARRTVFLSHVFAASVALFVGGFQFFPKLRARYLNIHRWLGRLYVLAVLLGGLAGLVIGSQAVGGPIAATGFSLLAIAWLGTTGAALWFVRTGQISAHQRWMTRSFALTFAAVTLRIYLLIFSVNGFSYTEASIYLGWICWVPNLVFAEWYLRRVKAQVTKSGTFIKGVRST